MSSSVDEESTAGPVAGTGGGTNNNTSKKYNNNNVFGDNNDNDIDDVTNSNNDGVTNAAFEHSMKQASGLLDYVFNSCSDDPKGSVHRAWGVSLIFVIVFFIISIIEMVNLQKVGSYALLIAGVITGVCHLVLGLLGTFVLKRFPTSFSIGFFLGILLVLANQNLIMFGTFYTYDWGTLSTNHIFGTLGFVSSLVLFIFALLLFHFKDEIVVAPQDAKEFLKNGSSALQQPPITNYEQYEDDDKP